MKPACNPASTDPKCKLTNLSCKVMIDPRMKLWNFMFVEHFNKIFRHFMFWGAVSAQNSSVRRYPWYVCKDVEKCQSQKKLLSSSYLFFILLIFLESLTLSLFLFSFRWIQTIMALEKNGKGPLGLRFVGQNSFKMWHFDVASIIIFNKNAMNLTDQREVMGRQLKVKLLDCLYDSFPLNKYF